MIKKIINPFKTCWNEEYNCFGCSPSNEIGLKMQFYDDGNSIISYWEPEINFLGYQGIVHGGIQATLMDEIAAWTVYLRCETSGVTKSMNVTYLNPLRSGKGKITIKSWLVEQDDNSAIIKAEIFNNDGLKCSEAMFNYYIYPQSIAIKRFNYPGKDSFYEVNQ